MLSYKSNIAIFYTDCQGKDKIWVDFSLFRDEEKKRKEKKGKRNTSSWFYSKPSEGPAICI